LAALAAGGCGGGGGSATSANSFVGNWFYVSSAVYTQACVGTQPASYSLDGYSVSISRDSSVVGGLIQTTDFDGNACVRYLDAVGNSATMATSSACSDRALDTTVGVYYTLSIVPTSETLTYQGGRSMRESSTQSLRYTYDDGEILDCTSSISGVTLTR
jgi:hypothetical protein